MDYSAQLATPSKNMFDDRSLYFLVGPMMKLGLSSLMDKMTPAQFGYDKIHPDQIGPNVRVRGDIFSRGTRELVRCHGDLLIWS